MRLVNSLAGRHLSPNPSYGLSRVIEMHAINIYTWNIYRVQRATSDPYSIGDTHNYIY